MKYNEMGRTGVLVSELCLGTMTFGGKGYWLPIGQVPQDEMNILVKEAFNQGINFIDTANVYSEGLSEIMLGEAIHRLGLSRRDLVIATKVRGRMGEGANSVGLSRLHIPDSVDESLKRMKLDHIDLLYIHGVDHLTPLEETMRALNDVVRAGKVRYLGISNHPAWMVVKANVIAAINGWTRFEATQNFYSLAGGDIERELVPMALSEGIGIMPWSQLAGGFLAGKYQRNGNVAGNSRRASFDFPPIDKGKAYDIVEVLQHIANNHNTTVAAVALNWAMRQKGVCSTIIGVKTPQQLSENLSSATLELSADEMEQLNTISVLKTEYPGWMVERQMSGRRPS